MKRVMLFFTGLIFLLSGCVARTYQLTQDRIDQSLSEGNRGYITGSHPGTEKPRKSERTVRVFEFELGRQKKIEKASSTNAGYSQPEYLPPEDSHSQKEVEALGATDVKYQKYTVGKNDTLQKISQKFYGTTRKWVKIYDANKDTLKTPDRVYPGQVLNIPEEGVKPAVEPVKETFGNLK